MSSYTDNKILFKTAMAVMAACNEKRKTDKDFNKRSEDWCRDAEYSALAYHVYGMLDGKKYSKNAARACTLDILDDEDEDIEKYPAPQGNDDFISWHGITCGDYLGYPTANNILIAKKCLEEFEKDTEVGYLGEIFRRHPEWFEGKSMI